MKSLTVRYRARLDGNKRKFLACIRAIVVTTNKTGEFMFLFIVYEFAVISAYGNQFVVEKVLLDFSYVVSVVH